MPNVLLIAQLATYGRTLSSSLHQLGYRTVIMNFDDEMAAIDSCGADLVLLILDGPSAEQETKIRLVSYLSARLPVVVATDSSNAQRAMEAIAAGAHDYLYLPLETDRLQVSLRNARNTNRSSAASPPVSDAGFSEFIGRSDLLMYVVLKARAQAVSGRHLLIHGERGVGKTMLARAMHRAAQGGNTLLPLHQVRHLDEIMHVISECARPATVMFDLPESGFFEQVSERGSSQLFAEAERRRLGLIFCQRTSRHGIRASNTPSIVAEKGVMETIFIPALRFRNQDVGAQCEHFLAHAARLLKRQLLHPTPQAYRLLFEHDWPGNTRQLIFVLWQAYLIADGPHLNASQLESILSALQSAAIPISNEAAIRPFNEKGELRRLEDIETDFLTFAFQHSEGSRSDIARKLGIGRTTLYRKARQIGLV